MPQAASGTANWLAAAQKPGLGPDWAGQEKKQEIA
jgi:hypothetical protein